MIYALLLFLIFICSLLFIHFYKIYIKTSTMAAVMAIGIVTQGVLLNFFGTSFLNGVTGKLLCILNVSLWFAFSLSFFKSFLDHKFKEIHLINLVNRFGIGTWVAGTSITGILVFNEFHKWHVVSEVLAYLNVGLWIIYIVMCFKTLFALSRSPKASEVHGILLLSTVSTQSIVLLLNTVFLDFPYAINISLLTTGCFLYLIGVAFILKRYLRTSWSIEKDWNNTNCILHGALSISGLACIVTDIHSSLTVNLIWILAATVFILVESIEIYRLVKRVRGMGVKDGLFRYDVSQWSRIFTFAMFYTFTSLLNPEFQVIEAIKYTVIHSGIWVVLILLVIEIVLASQNIFGTYNILPKKMNQDTKATSHV